MNNMICGRTLESSHENRKGEQPVTNFYRLDGDTLEWSATGEKFGAWTRIDRQGMPDWWWTIGERSFVPLPE
jgi:hypothetical protein